MFLEIRNDSNDDGAQIVLGKFNKETGDNQRWYIKSKGMPKISKLLVDSHNALDNKFIENIKIEPSNNYTYHFWMYIEDRSYRKNLDKHILHKIQLIHLLEVLVFGLLVKKMDVNSKYTLLQMKIIMNSKNQKLQLLCNNGFMLPMF